ncbi:thioesterase family protein [Stigmatella hybrida]|uniref:thioesterase family protein n=1 Tax=Stigmatella hybrida TaxID=394097 RepID=UPI001CDB11E7|nr:thioesterase family protein [Stigmatella hybrida]
MAEQHAYFIRTEDGRFLPQRPCAGAWNTEELHISPVNGLLLHELQRWLAGRPGVGKLVTRISYDYLGVLDFTECDVTFEMLRPGRAIDLVEGILSQHGRPVLRARVWLLSAHDTSEVEGGAREPLLPPEDGRAFDLTRQWPGDYIQSIDVRVIEGPAPGRTTAWITTPLAIVEGEPVSDLARFALLADTANGIAVRQRPDEWQFPNVDLTIHVFRQPAGTWIGFDTRVIFGPTGHGLTSTDLFDIHGQVGRAEQILLVRRR